MSSSRLFFLYLWIAPHVLQAVLALMMIRRQLFRQFPVFFAYTVFEVAQFLVLFVLDHWFIDKVSIDQYVNLYMIGNAISIVLRFGIVHEIFANVFQSYPALQQFGGVIFRWATVVLMIVAVTIVAYSSGSETDKFTLAATVVDRAVSIVQCGLLVLLVLLARFLSFSWTSYVFGIALGLGFFASLQLAISTLRAHLGAETQTVAFSEISMAVYHCCVLFWIVTLLLPQRSSRQIPPARSHQLEHWNDVLQRLL